MKNALILLAAVGAIALLGCEGKPDTTKPASSATPANAAPAGTAAPAPTGGW